MSDSPERSGEWGAKCRTDRRVALTRARTHTQTCSRTRSPHTATQPPPPPRPRPRKCHSNRERVDDRLTLYYVAGTGTANALHDPSISAARHACMPARISCAHATCMRTLNYVISVCVCVCAFEWERACAPMEIIETAHWTNEYITVFQATSNSSSRRRPPPLASSPAHAHAHQHELKEVSLAFDT